MRKRLAAQIVCLGNTQLKLQNQLFYTLAGNKYRQRSTRRQTRIRPKQLTAGNLFVKAKRTSRTKSIRHRRLAKLRCKFVFNSRLSPYSRIRPFWIPKEYKKKYLRRLTIKKRSRLARLQPVAQFSSMIQSIWGHLGTETAVSQLPKSGWYSELTNFAHCIGGLNRTIGAGHFSSLWSVASRIASITACALPGNSRNASRTRRSSALVASAKRRRLAGASKPTKRRFRKVRKSVRSRMRYTDLVLQVPSQLLRYKLRSVLLKRIRSYARSLGRNIYRNSINTIYIPRIHARLPFNPKWLKRQTKPTRKKKTIIMSKRMCAVEEKGQRASLRRSAVTLGGQPTLTLRR